MMRLSTEVLGDMQASMKPTLPEFDAGRRLSVVSIALRSFERKNKSAKQRKTLRRVAHRSGQETNNQNTKWCGGMRSYLTESCHNVPAHTALTAVEFCVEPSSSPEENPDMKNTIQYKLSLLLEISFRLSFCWTTTRVVSRKTVLRWTKCECSWFLRCMNHVEQKDPNSKIRHMPSPAGCSTKNRSSYEVGGHEYTKRRLCVMLHVEANTCVHASKRVCKRNACGRTK